MIAQLRLSTAQLIASDLTPEAKVAALADRLWETVTELRGNEPPNRFRIAKRLELILNVMFPKEK